MIFTTINKIIDEYDQVEWINLISLKYKDHFKSNKIFCDKVHYTTQGNKIVSKIINDVLNLE
jgi:hypothetical protein